MWQRYISPLVLKVQRYTNCTDIDHAVILHKSIQNAAAIALTHVTPLLNRAKRMYGNRKCVAVLTELVEIATYFVDFKVRFHCFIALQGVDKKDETRVMIARMNRLIDDDNENKAFYFFPFGKWH